jgi:hypothetical protein
MQWESNMTLAKADGCQPTTLMTDQRQAGNHPPQGVLKSRTGAAKHAADHIIGSGSGSLLQGAYEVASLQTRPMPSGVQPICP